MRELFTVGMGMYTKNKPKESALYQFWWEYIDGALATDLVDAAAGKLAHPPTHPSALNVQCSLRTDGLNGDYRRVSHHTVPMGGGGGG